MELKEVVEMMVEEKSCDMVMIEKKMIMILSLWW